MGSQPGLRGFMEFLVTLGQKEDRQTIKSQFQVIDWPSPYHCIIGHLTMATLCAVSSTIHLKIHYHNEKGSIWTVLGDLEVRRECLLASFKKQIVRSLEPPEKPTVKCTVVWGINVIKGKPPLGVPDDSKKGKRERRATWAIMHPQEGKGRHARSGSRSRRKTRGRTRYNYTKPPSLPRCQGSKILGMTP